MKKIDNKSNEQLLDEIMQESERKHKGYLLNDKKTEVSVFKKANIKDDVKNTNTFSPQNSTSQYRGNPIFVVNDKTKKQRDKAKNSVPTYYKNSKKTKEFNIKKFGIFVLCVLGFALVFSLVAVGIILTEKHSVNITCGNFSGITLKDENNNDIESISLKLNEEYRFKIVIKQGFEKNSTLNILFNNEKLTPDNSGYYTIKNTNNILKLHIGGIVPNGT